MLGVAATLESAEKSPYRELLGEAFESLHPNVRMAHLLPLDADGSFDVAHGTHRLAPLFAKLLRLPASGLGQPVKLRLRAGSKPGEVVWRRQIGPSALNTVQFARSRRLFEKNGLGCVVFDLTARDGSLEYRQVALRFAGLRLPDALSPRVEAHVSPSAPGWNVEVVVTWHGHLICRYGGGLSPK
ncbi:MAG: DUF4166 domain-containing protein [Fimbriimonadales bacterium]